MNLVLVACQSAIRCASVVVPRALRREWRDDWLGEVGYGYANLVARGEPRTEICRKLARFSVGSFRDAADLYCQRFDVRSFLGHPALPVAAPLVLLGLLLAFTHGLRNCREALAGLTWERPEELVLLSRTARVVGVEAVPTVADYLDWQRRFKIPMAGFVIDHATLRVTPDFARLLGGSPRLPLDFLGHRIEVIQPLEQPTGQIGVLARLRNVKALTALPAANGSTVGVRPIQSRMREPLIFTAAGVVMVLGIGILLVMRRPGSICYFGLKTGLSEIVLAAACAEGLTGIPIPPTGGYGVLVALVFPVLLLAASGVLLWACWRDHGRRCPVCGRLLAAPVRIGSRASVAFGHMGEETLCVQGHGSLFLAERPFAATDSATWVAFDESWKDCFASSGGSK